MPAQSLRAESLPKPTNHSYTDEDIDALAAYSKDCEIMKLDYKATQDAYNEAQLKRSLAEHSDLGTILGFLGAGILIGFVAGSSTR